MVQNLINGLWITLIGMGLVFLALLLLWALMEAMVRLTTKSALAEQAEEAAQAQLEETAILVKPLPQAELRPQAAAAAVAVALARRATATAFKPAPAGENASAWRAVQRAAQLNRHAAMFSRKQRGTLR